MSSGNFEDSSLEQSVVLPADSVQLSFYLFVPTSSGNGTDFMRALVDGELVFSALENYGTYQGGYTVVQVDLDHYADGESHHIRFEATTQGEHH